MGPQELAKSLESRVEYLGLFFLSFLWLGLGGVHVGNGFMKTILEMIVIMVRITTMGILVIVIIAIVIKLGIMTRLTTIVRLVRIVRIVPKH